MNEIDELLTLREAAQILKVSQKTIMRWEKAGKVSLVFLPIGNRPRIKISELNRIMSKDKAEVDLLWI